MKTITVIIVSYNQEDVISRCLDSILIQKDYGLKHIVVCDDCSKDHTWDVLQIYQEKYPEILKIYRNERNLGIYPNMEKAVSLRGEADLYHQLAGDDALCDGWFEQVQDFIMREKIDFSIPIGIYSDWKSIDVNGNELLFKQMLSDKKYNLFSLYIRGRICNRSLIVNNKVINSYSPVLICDNLNLVESDFDSQDHRIIQKAYYVPYVGTVYYSGIGVSTSLTLDCSDYYSVQNIEKWSYFLSKYIENDCDRYYAYANIEVGKFYLKQNLFSIIKAAYFFQKGRLPGMNYSLSDVFNFIRPMIGYLIHRYK